MALLMSDKIDFKSKSVMRHSGTLSINNRVSSTWRYKKCKSKPKSDNTSHLLV